MTGRAALQGTSDPEKVFDRTSNLEGTQIISYRVDPLEKWAVLIGIAPGAPERWAHALAGSASPAAASSAPCLACRVSSSLSSVPERHLLWQLHQGARPPEPGSDPTHGAPGGLNTWT